jgi:hypothetical protein
MPDLESQPSDWLSSPAEQRRTPRHDPLLLFRCLVLSTRAEEGFGAGILDISTGGVGLVVEHGLEPGQVVTLRFSRIGLSPPFEVSARVAYCQPQSCGDLFAGCEFDTKLSEAEVRTVVR